jgi:hypothetical protein
LVQSRCQRAKRFSAVTLDFLNCSSEVGRSPNGFIGSSGCCGHRHLAPCEADGGNPVLLYVLSAQLLSHIVANVAYAHQTRRIISYDDLFT